MRILDLGCHDGFVSNWIGRKLKEEGVDVHIDGVELNPDAVAIAQKRALRDNIPGTFRVGRAEDAGWLFTPGTYDVVVAFELIEHVPYVPQFLQACESMCNVGGQVYLSTPDGTFGEGQNPHHLRAYRSIDLFDLIRRRGYVENMLIGFDNVTVAQYRPSAIPGSMGEAVVYCGPGWEKWSPRDIDTKGLGGSETAAVHVAHELSKQGYTVTVYGECEQTMHRQVSFRHHSAYDPLEPTALTIVSRAPQLFDRPIRARRKVLWMHDTDYGPLFTAERARKMDGVFVLSDWHAQHVSDCYPFLNGKVIKTRNGINPERFPQDMLPPRSDRPHRAIYSSSPDRGLDLMLDIWPDVRKRVEDAELVYCYSSVYDSVADKDPKVAAFREQVRKLADQEGVTNLGSLDQWKLAGAMAKARVWLAPSFHSPTHTPFSETYCIGAVEAQAAGCYRIASAWGALPERECATLIDPPQPLNTDDGWPTEGIDRQAWVDAIVEGLLGHVPDLPSIGALDLTWEQVALDLAG